MGHGNMSSCSPSVLSKRFTAISPTLVIFLAFSLRSSFTETYFVRHRIDPFKVYKPVDFGIFRELYKSHY